MDAIALFISATARYMDTQSNPSGMFASLISELVITNNNLVDTLKENTRLKQVLDQYQKYIGETGGSGSPARGGTSQQKKRDNYC